MRNLAIDWPHFSIGISALNAPARWVRRDRVKERHNILTGCRTRGRSCFRDARDLNGNLNLRRQRARSKYLSARIRLLPVCGNRDTALRESVKGRNFRERKFFQRPECARDRDSCRPGSAQRRRDPHGDDARSSFGRLGIRHRTRRRLGTLDTAVGAGGVSRSSGSHLRRGSVQRDDIPGGPDGAVRHGADRLLLSGAARDAGGTHGRSPKRVVQNPQKVTSNSG